MSVSYKVHPAQGIITYQVVGKNSLDILIKLYTDITEDPEYNASFNGLADWRKAITSLNRDEVRALASYVVENRLSSGIWVALVEEPMVTAYAQIYSGLVENQHPMEVCSTVEHASKLLSVDLSTLL